MSGDELIGYIIEVTADHLRLGASAQDIIANTLDQRGLPTGRDGASVSQLWQAIRQSCEGSTASSRSTYA